MPVTFLFGLEILFDGHLIAACLLLANSMIFSLVLFDGHLIK